MKLLDGLNFEKKNWLNIVLHFTGEFERNDMVEFFKKKVRGFSSFNSVGCDHMVHVRSENHQSFMVM